MKVATGRLRPNFFAYCDYAGYRAAVNSGNYSYYYNNTVVDAVGDLAKCTGPAFDVDDAQKSFPSGHAAISFGGLVYTVYLLRFVMMVKEGNWVSIRNVLAYSPLYLATWISVTRIQDGEHFTSDVVGGALIGIFVATIVWTTTKNYLAYYQVGPQYSKLNQTEV